MAAVWPRPAHASTPIVWCGPDPAAADRQPDETLGFAYHLIYAYPADGIDRFVQFAPVIAGDAAAIDAWWRGQDPTRFPRLDLFPGPCASGPFGRLDISRIRLQGLEAAYVDGDAGFERLVKELAGPRFAFAQSEKKYLVYYDGTVSFQGSARLCGAAYAGDAKGGPDSYAFVALRNCRQEERHDFRALTAAHEMIHALYGVLPGAPHACAGDLGHVCDSGADAMVGVTGRAPGAPLQLSSSILDVGRDDYYGLPSQWDIQDSLFLERLDSPDRLAPSPPPGLTATNDATGAIELSWDPSSDDQGPVSYRVYRDGQLAEEDVPATRTTAPAGAAGQTFEFAVRAADAVGHLSQPAQIRFTVGLGIVDAAGRLLRDTVPPAPVRLQRIERTRTHVRLRWTAAPDAGGLRGYRVDIGFRRFILTPRPSVSIPRARLRAQVRIVAVDRGGNASPPLVLPAGRLR